MAGRRVQSLLLATLHEFFGTAGFCFNSHKRFISIDNIELHGHHSQHKQLVLLSRPRAVTVSWGEGGALVFPNTPSPATNNFCRTPQVPPLWPERGLSQSAAPWPVQPAANHSMATHNDIGTIIYRGQGRARHSVRAVVGQAKRGAREATRPTCANVVCNCHIWPIWRIRSVP